ncbi:MAG: alanine--tRNA ligase [Desulfurococcaceae archaeon]
MDIGVNYDYLRANYNYSRYKCKNCGEYFWSRVPRDTCPDRPCSKYEFLFKEYRGVNSLSISDTRQKFIDFLVRRGHGVVQPYPVLAKWRNDLYLTIASIIVFQPSVTDGLVDPPYNPLVVVQPSIRLTDIDNVGLTFGRHLSSFEMGGMHAFNKQGKVIYWSDGILENTIDFFTNEIGVELDDLVFKEGWWEGGGNAGPAPEVLIDGLEVATLVHMAYKVVNGQREPNPILVVDCGYGIERIAWFTQKTPTGFHSIYGGLVKKYKDILGVEEPPYDILKNSVYELSNAEISDMNDFVKRIRQLGLEERVKDFLNAIYLYSTLDHVRTAELMLADGAVPSNTGEGYLVRLIIRRLLRNLVKLGVEHYSLPKVVVALAEEQAKYWKNDYIYDKFSKHVDYIADVLETEANKFTNTVIRGIEVVEKIIKRKKTISGNDLAELYDSHGIPPEFVAERAMSYGVHVEISRDFYSMIASKHSSPRALAKEKEHVLSEAVSEWAAGFDKTRVAFHESPYTTSARARVLGVRDNNVILDVTIAYPWGGGQDHDVGLIRHGSEDYKITYVGKVGDVIVHSLERPPLFKPGDEVVVEIDWERRYKLMKHHTATHIVLAAARKVLGEHVWQAGAEKTTEKARLDITHHKSITEEELKRIEDIANDIVASRLDLKFCYADRFKAEETYGPRIYQGGAVYSPLLRVVEIPGWDAQACFGTHVYNTSEVGGIKIIKSERIQDGVIRLEFIAGIKLVEYIRELEAQREEALAAINVKDRDIVAAVKKLYASYVDQDRLLNTYREVLSKMVVEKALAERTDICGTAVSYVELPLRDEKLIKEIVEELSFKNKTLVAIAAGDSIELSIDPARANELKLDLRDIIQHLAKYEVKGGGKEDHVFLKTASKISKEDILGAVKNLICAQR